MSETSRSVSELTNAELIFYRVTIEQQLKQNRKQLSEIDEEMQTRANVFRENVRYGKETLNNE